MFRVVSKFKEQFLSLSNLSHDVRGRDVAYRYLTQIRPCEPEMVMALCNSKVAHTCSQTKKTTLPIFVNMDVSNIVKNYLKRPSGDTNVTLYDFLHLYTWDKDNVKRYKSNNLVLVGIKHVSLWNDQFFFQHSLLHTPLTATSQLLPDDYRKIPDDLKMFSIANKNQSDFWSSNAQLRQYCTNRGDRYHFVETFLAYVQSFRTTWSAYRFGQIDPTTLQLPDATHTDYLPLSPQQTSFVEHVMEALNNRASDLENVDKLYLLSGEHGTGKTACSHAIVQKCIPLQQSVLICTPTGNCFLLLV